jgi:tetratricopeptide (TPR) repeat protein
MYRIQPAYAKYVGELAYSESNLGIVALKGFKRPINARPHFERSLKLFEHAARLAPADVNWKVEAADACAWISETWSEEKKWAEARAWTAREERIKKAILAADPENLAHKYALVITTRSLGHIYLKLGQYERAEGTLNAARTAIAALLDEDPENAVWRGQAGRIEVDRTELLIETGRESQAQEALQRARSLLNIDPTQTAPITDSQEKIRKRVDELQHRLDRSSV